MSVLHVCINCMHKYHTYTSRLAILGVGALRKSPITNRVQRFQILFRENMSKKYHQGKKRQKTASSPSKDGSTSEGVLIEDVRRLLAFQNKNQPVIEAVGDSPALPAYTPPERFSEIEVKIQHLSAAGDGLGLSSTADHVYVVPFTVPGDVVKANVVNYFAQDQYTLTDFVEIISPGPRRDNSLVKCQYFSRCSGCQFQMLPYEEQLIHKKAIIERAYHNFSSLTPDVLPVVGDTIGSPLQYGYRTKLTPHFDGPPGSMSRKAKGQKKEFTQVPAIGFLLKGTRKTIDIEDCPIGTDAVREGMKRERERVAREIANYRKGATLLLRESTTRTPILPQLSLKASLAETTPETSNQAPISEVPNSEEELNLPYTTTKTCITTPNTLTTEYIDSFQFSNPAGAFFQNNNSILPLFTSYIRAQILPPPSSSSSSPSSPKPKYLIDAYCGSALFTITLSSLFSASLGIDIAPASIISAKHNATLNSIPNTTFLSADASAIFASVPVEFTPAETVVVIDPPRKGCDEQFLKQLLRFGPGRLVYVSCNVHTQARDVGVLVEGISTLDSSRKGNEEGKEERSRYEIESLRGFDFFPQTGHVEAVAILNRVG